MPGFINFKSKGNSFVIAKDRLYTPEGIWVRFNNSLQRIGLSDYAQATLGAISYVDFYQVGIVVKAGDIVATLEGKTKNFDMISQTSGYLASINPLLLDFPQTINEDPYGEGWVVEISPNELRECLPRLITPDTYVAHLEQENSGK